LLCMRRPHGTVDTAGPGGRIAGVAPGGWRSIGAKIPAQAGAARAAGRFASSRQPAKGCPDR